ncbi:baseplate J/gp47 family protein [Deinococcus sp. S9]|uniref:baseplate J/gp47 family protein n=1 Tax=Deinococcus sp. S9 TaxID=2545754 RepID=UPI001055FC95|nr:baseplate J/gp47 family protein [Deinococcus sp. S9]TDE85569.1 hypothetical protein E0686_11190 [Deinococcus sp. S9]
MTDPYTLLPADLDPSGGESQMGAVYAPTRQTTFAASMLRTLKASPLRLYSWGRGNLPRRLIDVFAGELELLSRTVADVAKRAISESTYRAWEDPALFPARGARTLARGLVVLVSPTPLAQDDPIPQGALFGSPDGRTVRAEQAVTFSAGTTTVTVPVVSEIPGSGGNFNPGEISLALSGRVNYLVSNPAPISGGRDEETDAEVRTRFQDFVESRATASRLSLYSAAMNTFIPDPADSSAQQRPEDAALILPWLMDGLNGEMSYGYVVVDGGGGSCTPELLAAVQASLERMEAAGDSFAAVPVNPWVVPLTLRAAVARNADLDTVRAALVAAWVELARGCRIEDGRGRGRLALFDVQAALEACHPDVVTVKITSHSADLQPPIGARLLAGELTAELLPGGVL